MVLNIEACINNGCKTLTITDNTGPYKESLNPNGWVQAYYEDLVRAEVTVTFNGELLNTYDVLSTLPNYSDILSYTVLATTEAFLDGEYLITYEVEDSLGVITNKVIGFFNICNVRCCVDKLWAKAAKEEPDCNCSQTSAYTKLALQAEAILGVIKNSASCLKIESRDKLLKKLQRICKFEKCNC